MILPLMIAAWALQILPAAPVAPLADPAQDVFIGTLAIEQGQPVLTRCDLSQNRYRLHDANGAVAVAAYVKDGRPAYGEVIGSYTEDAGQPALVVTAIDALTPGKDCHLVNALNADIKAPDPAFVGHYYLSGAMETGSELLLHPNGKFEWYISYGAVDQVAQGTWARDGKSIMLTSALPAKDKPLFAFIEVEPWSVKAEDEMLRRERDAKSEEVPATCPFLTGDWVSTPPIAMPQEANVTPAELHQRADEAVRKAQAARMRVEVLAREVMAQPASERAAHNAEVTQVLGDWLQASDDAREASRKAGLGVPKQSDPVLPAACALPSPAAASTPAAWAGGLGVRVFDMDSHQGATDVDATLQFADGHEMHFTTAGRGLAIARGPFAADVVKVTLHGDFAQGRDASFDVPATRSGIIHFSIDASQLTAPPFSSLRLRIEGKALIPDIFGRGRYERQP